MSEFTTDEVRVLKGLAAGILGGASKSNGSTASQAGAEASDAELDGQYSDPSIRKDPKRWAGESQIGNNYSQCPPDYLDCLAEFLEWSAGMDRNKPDAKRHAKTQKFYWEYNLQDARRARGWARRIRAGGVKPTPKKAAPPPEPDVVEGEFDDGGGDLPF